MNSTFLQSIHTRLNPAIKNELVDCLGNALVIWIILAFVSGFSGFIWPMLVTLLASGACWAMFFASNDPIEKVRSWSWAIGAIVSFGLSLTCVGLTYGAPVITALIFSMVLAVVLPICLYLIMAIGYESSGKPAA